MRQLIALILCCVCSNASAINPTNGGFDLSVGGHSRADSAMQSVRNMPSIEQFPSKMDRFTSSKAYQICYIGVPLIIGGFIVKSEDNHFRSLRNEYLPSFRKHYDDYLQYLPGVVMFGLKTVGVEGRSSWGRMLVSDVFSAMAMAITVNALKHTTSVMRPDGSNEHSFPSGHTATAFMTATMLSKEYGERSAWYSIGAYSTATATGLSRMMNNKHWLSDVMVGAGIGILSVELGYFLADMIFKERGIRRFPDQGFYDEVRNPSFFGIYLGFNSLLSRHRLADNSEMAMATGSNAGLEGAWFINPYFGIGGVLSAANMPVILDKQAQNKSLGVICTSVGAYFSYPITTRWLAGGKILAGYSHFSEFESLSDQIGNNGGINLGTGCSLTFLAKQNMGIKFFVDYNTMQSPVRAEHKNIHLLTSGSSVLISF